MSIQTSATIKGYLSQIKFPFKNTLFEYSSAANEKFNWNCYLDGSFDRLDTKYFDKKMLETCDGISPIITICYRVLKFILNYFNPLLRNAVKWSDTNLDNNLATNVARFLKCV